MEYELFKASLILKFRYVKGQCSHIENVEKDTHTEKDRERERKTKERERKRERAKKERDRKRE